MKDSIKRYENIDAIIFGGRTYPSMAEYWQNAESSSKSPLEREFAQKINEKKKYVISRSKVETVWNNSEQLRISDIDSLAREIGHLRQETEKDITVESGLGLWQIFIQNSLFDEICSQIHPVIAAEGEKLFNGDETKIPLFLSGIETFDNGIVKMIYQKERRIE